ncbi:putative large subunit rRNA processing protein [Plasmodium gaboni]|uniref:Ribosome biogenesis protein BOP1 homolog n=1 Tax=Plasmodium gaboni TaxID=647221 RepID=A0A151L9P2_9APIC|nr:putative large subunit rRNA processing protein [Plasmodium gaboni]KYN95670.1 putative large subunit rRNA processing protein [Plasmodium gaboni]
MNQNGEINTKKNEGKNKEQNKDGDKKKVKKLIDDKEELLENEVTNVVGEFDDEQEGNEVMKIFESMTEKSKKKKDTKKMKKKKKLEKMKNLINNTNNEKDEKDFIEMYKKKDIKKKKKKKNIKKDKKKSKDTDYEDTVVSSEIHDIITGTGDNSNIYINEEIDESDDEYNINTLGNFDLKNYEDFDIIGYDIEGNKIYKSDENLIDDFIKSRKDENHWRTIKDVKNNRVIQLTDADLQIIKSIRENKVATVLNDANYIYENDKEEYKLYPSGIINQKKNEENGSVHERKKILKIMKYLRNKEKYPERYKDKKENDEDNLYDLWNNRIYDEFNNINEISLPHILPGHKYSYNPPPELMLSSSEKRNLLKNNKDAFIPQNFKNIRNIEYYKKTYFDLYQRCLDIYLCSRSLKNVLHINKEDLLPKLPSKKSLKPYPECAFIHYVSKEQKDEKTIDDINNMKMNKWISSYIYPIDVNENDNCVYTIYENKLCIFDILTSYNIATIDLLHYFKSVRPLKTKKKSIDEDIHSNIMIKVNKAYSILAISYSNVVFILHYETYVPPIKSQCETVIDNIYDTNSDEKRKKQKSGESNISKVNKSKNDALEEESISEGDDNFDDGNDENFDDDDDENFDDDDYENFDEDDDNMESDASYDAGTNNNTENTNNDNISKKKKQVHLNRNIVYNKTKGLLSAYHSNFKNSEEYCYSKDINVKWMLLKSNHKKIKYCVAIKHEGEIKHISWNNNGNYLSVTCMRSLGQYNHCYLHHMKSMKSIKLIKKYKQKRGNIISTMFFPKSPYFMVAFENNIIIYNLKATNKKERIFKKLRGVQNITSMDVHRNESYILVSDSLGNVFIFDLDLSCNPYKKFHLQECPLKKVQFHKSYNLFYSLSDNGKINLFYSKFFQDYITNPVLLPIKEISNESKIVDIVWSENKPWFFIYTQNNFSVLYT